MHRTSSLLSLSLEKAVLPVPNYLFKALTIVTCHCLSIVTTADITVQHSLTMRLRLVATAFCREAMNTR